MKVFWEHLTDYAKHIRLRTATKALKDTRYETSTTKTTQTGGFSFWRNARAYPPTLAGLCRLCCLGGAKVKAWHFLPDDYKLGYGDGRKVRVGETYTTPDKSKPICLCNYGMHGSRRILDALTWAAGTICCRVEITGEVIEGHDKIAGRNRTVLAMIDVNKILHEFACCCAEDALALTDNPEPSSVAAIQVKRDWLCGRITAAELAAARNATCRLAKHAARESAKCAAKYAAKHETKDIAWDTAWDTAWKEAREKQNRRLTAMVNAAMKESHK